MRTNEVSRLIAKEVSAFITRDSVDIVLSNLTVPMLKVLLVEAKEKEAADNAIIYLERKIEEGA